MLTVYIETSIPSMYFETRADRQLPAWRAHTKAWWRLQRRQYRLVTSQFVLEELALTPVPKRRMVQALVSGVSLLPVPDDLDTLIDYYIRNRAMPRNALGDAAHLAMCASHAVDYLLTWNCRHLANPNKLHHIRSLNLRLGLPTPMILTPETMRTLPESP